MGDPTAAMQGRLTLNPIKHIDPFWTILMPVMLYVMTQGRFVFGGAKPVPINPYNFRDRRTGMMLSGIAGPAVNLAVMLVFALITRLLVAVPTLSSHGLIWITFRVGLWNMMLMVFNMVPIPPLDGSRVLSYMLPRNMREPYDKLERYGLIIVILVVYSGFLSPLFERAFVIYGRIVGVF